mgnify:CR=1 FL=1
MNIKPWREVARPHKDVLEGTFKQSEFAADISAVAGGTAPPEYQDAEKFFSRTFITEGMRLLLMSVAQRLAGQGGDPVIQLQTAFGGGKTHTMLAVMHLARRQVATSRLPGVPPILDAAGIAELPQARLAVLDGIRLAPNAPQRYGNVTVNTLWGELAWQLLGEAGFNLVAASDASGTSPGKETLILLLKQAAPCVILMDETVAFFRQLEPGATLKAGTFDSNLSFIQALTEALKSVPDAVLLASLPESDLEVGGTMGQRALNALEKYFARVESVWKPVAATEAFEIVRRRLFEWAGTPEEITATCRTFADFYRQHPDKFPQETQDNDYFERLCQSYPIHPEIFDRLYEDWSTLDKFQRTRGVLQYMAIVIHRLWNSDNRDALIMPGSIMLEDSNVRSKSIHYLPQGWEPVIESEVDGGRSKPYDIDSRDTRFGGVQAARRTMRTIFLGSAAAATAQGLKGVKLERILLGSVQPGQTIGYFEDALKRLVDSLHYLYADQGHFWLDTKPNLRREMEGRKQNVNELEQLLPLLCERVRKVFGSKHSFAGVHVFTGSADIPDEYGIGPRLVVLPLNAGYSRNEGRLATDAAIKILRFRGDQPRQKQNRLVFLAPDYDVVSRLKDQARTFIAWRDIVADVDNGRMNLDLYTADQARRNRESSDKTLMQLIRETYKWVLCPTEEFEKGVPTLRWEAVTIPPAAPNLIAEIETKLIEEEWLIPRWSPLGLRDVLNKWYFKGGATEVSALKVWQDCCHYLYLPRLASSHVFEEAIRVGVESEDFFGLASGKEGDRYLNFSFGKGALVFLEAESLLIEREAAAQYKQAIQPPPEPAVTPTPVTTETPFPTQPQDPPSTVVETITPDAPAKRQFYATVNLDPVRAKMDFATIVDEVVQNFTLKPGAKVTISVDIQVSSNDGFDEGLQRTVRENCRVLKFTNAEFEE